MKNNKIKIGDLESFSLDDVLQKVKERKKQRKWEESNKKNKDKED